VPPPSRARAVPAAPFVRQNGGRWAADLRAEATRRIDDFVAGSTDLGSLARWVGANTRHVNAGGDDATRELVGKARLTIDAYLHGRVAEQGARDYLAQLLTPGRPTD
jgi:hypothetical protein